MIMMVLMRDSGSLKMTFSTCLDVRMAVVSGSAAIAGIAAMLFQCHPWVDPGLYDVNRQVYQHVHGSPV